jgi:hypothetical protein
MSTSLTRKICVAHVTHLIMSRIPVLAEAKILICPFRFLLAKYTANYSIIVCVKVIITSICY